MGILKEGGCFCPGLTGLLAWTMVIGFIFFSPATLLAQSQEETRFLDIYFTESELQLISSTRSLTSLSRVAENVSIITAQDILLMNAHTLADVLRNVPGVQLASAITSPGSIMAASIQGSEIRHVTVLLDGIPLNNLSDNVSDIGLMPVQPIAKLEIIKGPASSAWGSALGGVINIITKSLPGNQEQSAVLSGSYGQQDTADLRAEARGRAGKLAYYLYAGRLQSDGQTSGFEVTNDSFLAKLGYDLASNTSLSFLLSYLKANRGDGEDAGSDLTFGNQSAHLYSSLFLHSSAVSFLDLDLCLWATRQDDRFHSDQLSDGAEVSYSRAEGEKQGARVNLALRKGRHSAVVGMDYEAGTLETNTLPGEVDEDAWALFANDTFAIADLSIAFGLRYDKTRLGDDAVNPSLGATYALRKDILLRLLVAQGFTSPTTSQKDANNEFFAYKANPDLTLERVRSYQLGVETTTVPNLWLKFSLFRHDMEDILGGEVVSDDPFQFTLVNKDEQRRQGLEVEFKTASFHDVFLHGGAVFIDATDLNTDSELLNVPKRTYDFGLAYEGRPGLKALLTGHFIDWNASPQLNARDEDFIVDMSLTKSLFQRAGAEWTAFLNVWNIFDTAQYSYEAYKNAGRWIEGGVRCTF
jgi:vitamin B12 transporter